MDKILLHASTRSSLEQMVEQHPHAVMLVGQLGSGKLTIAENLAALLLGRTVDQLHKYPYYQHIHSDGAVTIEQIRILQNFVQLKTTGKGLIRRIAIIEDAHTLTIEAQNALLKVLEEPPADTAIILTVQGEHSLKPTIYSRVQRISIKSPPLAATKQYFVAHGYKGADIEKAYLMSDGGTGLVSILLSDDNEHPLQANIALAKELITIPTYQRLLRAAELSKAKENIPSLLYAIKRVSTAALEGAAHKGQDAQVAHWHKVLTTVFAAEKSLSANPNPKLLLTNLFLNI